ncbi:hypothetical protein J7E43_00500 [Bacillus sp. ISL-8]|nr:hypothetical protein [Bacillus sp. ISL-8]
MLNSTPSATELWEGIGGHFENLSQVLCEFLDNSISNIISTSSVNRSIIIKILPILDNEKFLISIEDGGQGISNFEPIMRLGDKSVKQSPLNEHGFGLKHALATANPENNNWRICTRTEEDFARQQYREINAGYAFEYDEMVHLINVAPWPGLQNATGTYIEFTVSKDLFNTLQSGIPGNAGFSRNLEYLAEDLGYIYAGVLSKGAVNIMIYTNNSTPDIIVQPETPDWIDFYQSPPPGSVNLDLGDGDVLIEYRFGEMKEGRSVKYYKRNMSSSGIEIRVNGRLLMGNLFKEVWGLENHPSYNHFLGQINIISDIPNRLPKTKTSKNSLRKEDPKLVKILQWIRKIYPTPERKLTNAISEREFIQNLAELKELHIRTSSKRIETDFTVYKNIGSPVMVDLYLFDGTDVVLYEAKKNTADVKDFYQLLMYWDGLVSDGGIPTEGILLAPDFSPGVINVINSFNGKSDEQGNNYNFKTKTWKEEGINYPN